MKLRSIGGRNFTDFMGNLERAYQSEYFMDKYPDSGQNAGGAVVRHISEMDWSNPAEVLGALLRMAEFEQAQAERGSPLARQLSAAKAELYFAVLNTLKEVDWTQVGWQQSAPVRAANGPQPAFSETALG